MFDFGFGFWILFFVIFFGCGRMCGWGARRYRRRHREVESGEGRESDQLSNLESRVKRVEQRDRARDRLIRPAAFQRGRGEEREPARLKRQPLTPLQELQKRFVEGRLTLSEYEREVDRLDRLE